MRQITIGGGGEGLRERSSSDRVTLVAQALLALAEHLESARACPPIGSATEPLKPAACRPQTPALPRGDDTEEVWHIAGILCATFGACIGEAFRKQPMYVEVARHLIEELDRYRSAPRG